jgi:TPR repeat protein
MPISHRKAQHGLNRMGKTNIILLIVALVLTTLLVGCLAPVIEGTQQGYDATRRVMLKHGATPTDPVEQYKLGNTYCCKGGGPLNDLSIYDNENATLWYCQSARQGFAPAQLQLARLYSGHAIRGVHVVLRASALVGNADTDFSTALMWASKAAENKDGEGDIDDAIELRKEIADKVTDEELAKTARLMKNWQAAACQWHEVIPPIKNTEK